MSSKSTWITPLLKQLWIASSVWSTMVGVGMDMGFTSSLLLALDAPDSDIKLTMEMSSWLVACLPIFCIVGYFTSSVLMDTYGRRVAFGVSILPGIAGVLLTSFAPDVSYLIVAQALTGISAGGTSILGCIVIGEYTSPKNRPMFINLKTSFFSMGSAVIHILGHYLHWRIAAGVMAIPFIIALFIVYTCPESPSWLAGKKMDMRSKESFFWLRERTEESAKEIEELIYAQRDNITEVTPVEKVLGFLKKFTKKNFQKPIVICMFAVILLESSGRHYFPAYATQIIDEIAGSTFSSFYLTLTVDIIITASSIFSSYLTKNIKLRTLLFSTGFVTVLILMIACLIMFLSSRNVISKDYSWISTCLFMLFFIFVNLGCAPIPLLLIGEIFPLEHRAVGCSMAGYLTALFMSIIFKIMPYMLVEFKIYGAFTILAVCMGIALIILYLTLPETKNRTLQEIDDFFTYGRFRDSDDDVSENNDDIESKSIIFRLSKSV